MENRFIRCVEYLKIYKLGFLILILLPIIVINIPTSNSEAITYYNNENVLCIYNNNTPLSRDICEYYSTKRPGSSKLALDIPIDKFIDHPLHQHQRYYYVDGKIGKTYEFGGGKYELPLINSESITISAWFRRRDNNTLFQCIFGGWHWAGNAPENEKDMEGFEIRIQGETLQFILATQNDSNNTEFRIIYFQLPENNLLNWYHVVATYNKSTGLQKMFVNGENVGTNQFTPGNRIKGLKNRNWEKNYIGYSITNEAYFRGKIDEVTILNRALDWQEVNNSYNKNNLGERESYLSEEIIGQWNFEEEVIPISATYEDMVYEDFKQYIIQPTYSWIDLQLDKNITHLAIAKDLPIRVPLNIGEYSFSNVTSGTYLLSRKNANITSSYNFLPLAKYDLDKRYLPFQKDYYRNLSGQQRLSASYLTGYSLEDIKVLIDKSISPIYPKEDLVWIYDKDQDNFSLSEETMIKAKNRLLFQGISQENVALDLGDEKPLRINKPIISYFGSGSYHYGYGRGLWALSPGNFEFNVSNRSILGSLESFNGKSFTGSPRHDINMIHYTQGRLADAFSPNAFGGENYSRSFSGGAAHIEEPFLNSHWELDFAPAYAAGLSLAESGNYISHPLFIVVGDPIMRAYDINNKLPVYSICSQDIDCIYNKCKKDLLGNNRCGLPEDNCILGNYYNNSVDIFGVEVNNGNYMLISGKIEEDYILKCIDGEWVRNNDFNLDKYSCSIQNHYTPNQNITCQAIPTNESFCINEFYRARVDNGQEVFCENGCRNGYCTGEIYTPQPDRTLSLLKNQKYGLTFKYEIANNSDINWIFYNFPRDTEIYKLEDNLWKKAVSSGSHVGFSPNINFSTGDGFIIKPSEDIELIYWDWSWTISPGGKSGSGPKIIGWDFEEDFNIHIVGNESLIGTPVCENDYYFNDILSDLEKIDPSCNAVSLIKNNLNYNPIWWSKNTSFNRFGDKKNLKIYPYESFIVYCSEQTDFFWTPSCEPSEEINDSSQNPSNDNRTNVPAGPGGGSGGSGSLGSSIPKEVMGNVNIEIDSKIISLQDNKTRTLLEIKNKSLPIESLRLEGNHTDNQTKIIFEIYPKMPDYISPKEAYVLFNIRADKKINGEIVIEFKVKKNNTLGINEYNAILARWNGIWEEYEGEFKKEDDNYYFYEAKIEGFSTWAIYKSDLNKNVEIDKQISESVQPNLEDEYSNFDLRKLFLWLLFLGILIIVVFRITFLKAYRVLRG
jgi:PGF-pre-PGF domain-containing protein